MRIKKAVIPVAGLGTRFLPATKSMPKEMLPIVDKPTIQYIVEEAVASGIEDILLVTGRTKKSIEDHFDYCPELEMELAEKDKQAELELVRKIADLARLHFIRQKSPKGLGHAVYCARSFVGNEPFAVLLGDDVAVCERPALRQLMDVYDQYGCSVIGVNPVEKRDVSRYGVIAPDPAFTPHDGVQKIVGLVDVYKRQVLLRQVMMEGPLATSFAGAPAQAVSELNEMMGITMRFGDASVRCV